MRVDYLLGNLKAYVLKRQAFVSMTTHGMYDTLVLTEEEDCK